MTSEPVTPSASTSNRKAIRQRQRKEDTQARARIVLGSKIAVVVIGGILAATMSPIDIRTAPILNAGELVVNGGFESGKSGWRVNNGSLTLTQVESAHAGRGAATVTTRTAGTVALNDTKNTVPVAKAATTYAVSAWIRSVEAVTAQLRIREVHAGALVETRGQAALLTAQWQKVSLTYRTVASGSSLDLNVVGWNVPTGGVIQIDDVSMRLVGSAAPNPTSSATTAGVAPTTAAGGSAAMLRGEMVSDCLSARGVPSCGAFIGAAVGSNADPAERESQLGGRMGLHRTYYQAEQVAAAVRNAKVDLAANRVPWISFKPAYSWADMADGKGDAWAQDLAQQLSRLDGPVWLAIYHEPENDGDIKQWTRMQAHLAPMIRAIAPNVAYSIILTGWHQTFGSNPDFQLASLWPGDEIVDIIGIDPYNDYGVVKDGTMSTKFVELKSFYTTVAPFASAHHVHWAVAETGYTDEAAAKDAAWLTRGADDLVSMGGVGFAYFDTTLNAYGSWPLNSTKLSAFALAMNNTLRLP